jgi:hypothetical protein
MKCTFDQIGFNYDTMQYTLSLSVMGNQTRIKITHEEAVCLLYGVKHEIEKTHNEVFWIPNVIQK